MQTNKSEVNRVELKSEAARICKTEGKENILAKSKRSERRASGNQETKKPENQSHLT